MTPDKEKLFADYYEKYFNKLKIYAYSSLGNWSRAEEAVQDTYHVAWIKVDDFLSSKNPIGWLINTLKFTIRNMQRRDFYQAKLFVSLSEIGDVPSLNDQELDLDVEGICESTLSKDDYYLLRRVVLDKATYKEMADELGINLWACQKRMQRILKKLKKRFNNFQ